jgi:hypothetical protein
VGGISRLSEALVFSLIIAPVLVSSILHQVA